MPRGLSISLLLAGLAACSADASEGTGADSNPTVTEAEIEAFLQAFPENQPSFPEGNAELARLFKQYGPGKSSWHFEEWIIRDYFDDKRAGFFVDVGAFQYKAASNTYALETQLDWSGIAIDAQEEFRAGYEQHRPKTRFFCNYVSDKSTGKKDFHVTEKKGMSSGVTKNKLAGEVTDTRQVTEITLNDLLDREGVDKIDFLTMDIELAEPAALRGFDIKRFQPALVCIEVLSHPPSRKFIEDYFKNNGYEQLALWSRVDSHNSYYVRAGDPKSDR